MYQLGDVRSFRVADPASGTGSDGFTVEAVLWAQSALASLWVDAAANAATGPLIDQFWSDLSVVVLPRVRTIWGDWGDVNGDGTISILLTPLLNAQGIAIGFFNPADLFAFGADSSSPSYNPTSNEMEII